jgi:hypothetical protein
MNNNNNRVMSDKCIYTFFYIKDTENIRYTVTPYANSFKSMA